jgi:DNA-binding transcriptional ArsR family regulator
MDRSALAQLGGLLADESRAQLLTTLLDGRAYSLGELAKRVGIAPSTASEHLAKLCDAGMLCVEARGRHRYFRLTGPNVAEMLEPLLGFLPSTSSIRSRAPSALFVARRCYDHLAGEIAVRLYEQLVFSGRLTIVDQRPVLTASGESTFTELGVEIGMLARRERPMVRSCLDWTERRHHLAGSVAASLLEVMLQRRWIAEGAMPRALVLTSSGRDGLSDYFDLTTANISVSR